ncbi:MAG: LysR family transcriptional regulator [Hoeflea sp. BRH_c9]|nr:MAG: LysR family transcriptional regulator [Hoeflea sp. BRH_c9]
MDKRYRNLPLNQLRTFSIAARHRTFTAAATDMGVSQVAISRQISALETYLGIKLFERGPRSVRLTEAGRAFGREISEAFDRLEEATHRTLSDESSTTINIRIYPTLAHHWLLPKLADFTERHPGYRIRLDTVVEPLDFRSTNLDLAVQLGHGDWSNAKSRKLFDEQVDVVCSPGYAQRFGNFTTRDSFDQAELLHAKYRRREWEVWASGADIEINHQRGMEFDSSVLAYCAARKGFGLALGQIDLLQDELEKGELICPVDRPVRTGSAFYVIWPTMKSTSVRTRHLIDWLLDISREKPEFFR